MQFDKHFAKSPYPGLRPFETEESDIFFGREKQTDELLIRLQKHHFLAVVGPSGCGKSSLVRAGMIAALKTGFMCDAGSRWRIASMRPGEHPLGQLATALLAAAPSASEYAPDKAPVLVEAALRRGPISLIEVAKELNLCHDTNLLVLVDQFEELFRFRQKGDPSEADAFVALLLNTAARRDLPIYIVITMRSDFIGDCALFRDLPEAINEGQYLTPRLTREQCAAAVRSPARVFGGDVDDSLVNQLLNDFGPDPDQLPILQHALMRMWHLRLPASGETNQTSGIVLTLKDYESKEVGGLQHALSLHADEVLAELTPEQQRIAQILFRRLTERGAGRRDTRAPARLQEIADIAVVSPAEIIPVVEAFRGGDRSFLTPRDGPLEPPTLLDIGHESLIRQWHTLSQWVDEEGESAAKYARLKETARLWKKGGAALWGTPDLEVALAWRRDAHPTEEWALRYGTAEEFKLAMEFLNASRERQQRLEEETHQAYLARIRRANRRSFASAALAVVMAGGVLFYLYLNVWPYTAYFDSYENVRGGPQGIGKLSRAQLKHRPTAFRITRKGRRGPVLHMEFVDRRGNWMQQPNAIPTYLYDPDPKEREDDPDAVRTEYTYDSKGLVMQEMAFDLQGNRVWGFIYLPTNDKNPKIRTGYYVGRDGFPKAKKRYSNHTVEIQYDENGYEAVRRYRTRGGKPVRGPFNAFGRLMRHDAQGREIEETSLGLNDQPLNDNYGNATWKATRTNALGETEEVENLNAAGAVTVAKDGWAIARVRYDDAGNILETSYFDVSSRPTLHKDGYHRATDKRDGFGNIIEERYWDVSGSLATGPQGCSGWDYQYDDFDNATRITCIGQDGKPTFNKGGYAIRALKFDKNHNVVDEQYFDTAVQPVLSSQGYARATARYDEKLGKEVEKAYFLADGSTPAVTDRGDSRVEHEYDPLGREVKEAYFGIDGKPVRINKGYAAIVKEYDDFDNIAMGRLLDEKGNPTIGGDVLVSGWRSRYDAGGQETELTYLSPSGAQMLSKEGFGGTRSVYDERNNEIEHTYLGLGGDSVVHDGVAGWRSVFDELGKETQRQFIGRSGEPAAYKQDYARVDQQYDNRGNATESRYYDIHGNPVMAKGCGPEGEEESATRPQCARKVLQYNDQNRVTEESYFDTNGKLVLLSQGWARVVKKYDSRGNLAEKSYYGANKQPILIPLRFHTVRFTYDGKGQDIQVEYLSIDGKPVWEKDGYARLTRTYDRFGRRVEERKFDIKGNPTLGKDGTHGTITRYDQYGHEVEMEVLGLNGQPGLGPDGWHIIKATYDQRGNVTETSYFGSKGQPVRSKKEGWARQVLVYDQQGRLVGGSRFDENGKRLAEVRVYYDANGKMTVKRIALNSVRRDTFALQRKTDLNSAAHVPSQTSPGGN